MRRHILALVNERHTFTFAAVLHRVEAVRFQSPVGQREMVLRHMRADVFVAHALRTRQDVRAVGVFRIQIRARAVYRQPEGERVGLQLRCLQNVGLGVAVAVRAVVVRTPERDAAARHFDVDTSAAGCAVVN